MCTHAPTTLAPALHLQYHATIWLESYWIHSWYFLADVCLLCILTLIKWWFWDTASDVKLSWYMCPGQQRLPAGIIISFWRKIKNRACDDTTISLGPGFLLFRNKRKGFLMCMVFEEKRMEDSTDYMKICVLVLEHNLRPQIGHVWIEYFVYYYVHSKHKIFFQIFWYRFDYFPPVTFLCPFIAKYAWESCWTFSGIL